MTIHNQKQKAELRIVFRAANAHAVAFYARLQGYDVYCGPRLNFGNEVFRTSYHESGKSHLRIPTSKRRTINEPSIPLVQIRGKKRLAAGGSTLNMLNWGYKPKLDSSTRRTLMIDLEEVIKLKEWGIELWALEPNQPQLVTEVLNSYIPGGVAIAHVIADWCTPNLIAIVWTLTPESSAALDRAILEEQNRSKE
jgi:hypothetical protein